MGQTRLPTEPLRTDKVKRVESIVRRAIPPSINERWIVYPDAWRGGVERTVRFYGQCIVCEHPVWAHDDGENDPRGLLGDNALWITTAERMEPLELRTCALCANDQDAYLRAQRMANEVIRKFQGDPNVKAYDRERLSPLVWPDMVGS